jgi:uncharacterized protein (DUF4415 family)
MKRHKKLAHFTLGRGYEQSDWEIVSDTPEATADKLAQARPFAEVFPDLAASARRTRGKQKVPVKTLVTLRMDTETLNAFKATGPGWQTRMNAALKESAQALKKA